MPALGWLLNLGFAGGAAITTHVVTIDGECLVADETGVKLDSQRTIKATIDIGDAAVNYVFEETELS